jgi:flagellar biogenesis protein FliO
MNTLFLGIIGGLILLIIILFWMVIRINRRVSDFTRGNEGVALEEVIKELIKDHEYLKLSLPIHYGELQILHGL